MSILDPAMTIAGFVPKLGIPDQPKLSQCAAVLVHGLEHSGQRGLRNGHWAEFFFFGCHRSEHSRFSKLH
eukprot:s561_g11.t1